MKHKREIKDLKKIEPAPPILVSRNSKFEEFFQTLQMDVQATLLLAATVGNKDNELGNRMYKVMSEAAKLQGYTFDEKDMPELLNEHFNQTNYNEILRSLK